MIQLTRRDLEEAYAKASDAHRIVSGYRTHGEKIAEHAIQSVEVLAGAAASGIVAGRFGAPHLKLGTQVMPLDLLGGVALHAAAFFGLFGKYGEHVHNFGDGVMAQYMARWGVGYGTHLREKAGLPRIAGASPQGVAQMSERAAARRHIPPSSSRRAPLTEAELAGIASQAR